MGGRDIHDISTPRHCTRHRHDGHIQRVVLLITLVTVALVAGWLLRRLPTTTDQTAERAPVPVVVAAVTARDVPHVTRAIGTVQSLNSVILRARVDGVLEQLLFDEGQRVEQGALMARIDDRALAAGLAQARAEAERSAALLHSATLDLERYANLRQRNLVPQQTFDQQRATVAQLAAAVTANRAAIANAEVQWSYTRIISPIGGRVGLRHIDPGNLIRATDTQGLVSVIQTDPIAILFALPQDGLPQIQALLRSGRPIEVSASARAGGAVLAQGRLVLLDNQIDAATGTVRLKAEFANADERLWPGQFVVVELATGRSAGAIVIPVAALQRGLERPFVYRVRNAQAEVAPVTVDYQDEVLAVIGSGLAVGDNVVTDGQSRLRAGAPVTTVAPSAPGDAR